jgi:septum formation protein
VRDGQKYAFVLASSSPARLATLRAAGLDPEVVPSDFDESSVRATTTEALVDRLATVKAQVVAAGVSGDAVVLGCDSMLDLDGRSLGKPASAEEAVERWARMRGREGHLYTGHCLIRLPGEAPFEHVARAVVRTRVRFADVSDDEIERYVATGEPANVAGAFTIDGLGGWFIEAVDGDHHNVVGVSLPRLRHLLGELGVSLPEIGWPSG